MRTYELNIETQSPTITKVHVIGNVTIVPMRLLARTTLAGLNKKLAAKNTQMLRTAEKNAMRLLGRPTL